MAEASPRTGSRPAGRRGGWGRFLLIWALSLLILGAVGCVILYRYFEVFEATRTEPVVEAYLAQTDAETLIAGALQNPSLPLTEYEDAEALYRAYLETVDTGLNLSYRSNPKNSSSERTNIVVYSGPSAICSLILTPEGSKPFLGFGRRFWKVSEVTTAPITDQLPSLKLEVTALEGAELRLNGRVLSGEDVAERDIPVPDLSRFEAALDPAPTLLRYEIGPLYGDVELTDADGKTLTPESNAGGTLRYTASSYANTVNIRAPEDVRVLVNGVALDRVDISQSDPGVLQDLTHYTGEDVPMTVTYRLAGLYLPPEVTAVDADGNTLTPRVGAEGSYQFFYRNDPEVEEFLRPLAEGFFNAYTEYSSHSWNANRANNLVNRILPGSRLYNYISDSRDTMIWASGTLEGYQDLTFDNFHRVSERCCTCTVRYSADMTDANGSLQENSFRMENAYELSFVQTNGTWLAAAMNVIAES